MRNIVKALEIICTATVGPEISDERLSNKAALGDSAVLLGVLAHIALTLDEILIEKLNERSR